MKVKKYNKKTENFEVEKIEESIKKASAESKEQIPDFMIKRIAKQIEEELSKDKNTVSVCEISKLVENKLMNNYKETARCYITYHYEREKEHIYDSQLLKAFKSKLDGTNIENSNANCDENSFSGRMNEAARVLLKDNALENMSKKFRDNHNDNKVYIHDLDSYSSGMHNCLSIPFDNLFKDGVTIKQTDLRGPRSISTAMQLVAVLMQIQSLQQFGGVAATHLDWTLIPYLRISFFKHLRDGKKYIEGKNFKIPKNCENISIEKYKDDKCYQYAYDMTKKETEQGAEALIHNLNSLQSRSGQQLPFSSINYGTCTYMEGRMITDAILEATLDGTGPLHKTPIFPCGIFQFDKDINGYFGTPNYDLFLKSLKCTAKRFYPNYANANWTTDINGRKLDVEHKKAVLEKLSPTKMEKLVEWVKNNKEEAHNYKMIIKSNTVDIDENFVHPVEIMSTMGKCKLQLI